MTRPPLDGAFTGWFYDGGETIAPFVVDIPDYRAFDDLTLPFETTIAARRLRPSPRRPR